MEQEIVFEGADWIQQAQDRVQWWVLVNMVMNLQAPQKQGIT
jgi:hypothetical protein